MITVAGESSLIDAKSVVMDTIIIGVPELTAGEVKTGEKNDIIKI